MINYDKFRGLCVAGFYVGVQRLFLGADVLELRLFHDDSPYSEVGQVCQ